MTPAQLLASDAYGSMPPISFFLSLWERVRVRGFFRAWRPSPPQTRRCPQDVMSQHWITVTESPFPGKWRRCATYVSGCPNRSRFAPGPISSSWRKMAASMKSISWWCRCTKSISSRSKVAPAASRAMPVPGPGRTKAIPLPMTILYLLANRKAKKLKSLLQHQKALRGQRMPYVEADHLSLGTGACGVNSAGAALHRGLSAPGERSARGYPDIVTVLARYD